MYSQCPFGVNHFQSKHFHARPTAPFSLKLTAAEALLEVPVGIG